MVTTRYSDQQRSKSRQILARSNQQPRTLETYHTRSFLALGGLHEDKLCYTSQETAPTNVKTVHQTFLLHIESNIDRLALFSPTHGQRSQQKREQVTLQSVLINKSEFLKATHRTEIRKPELPRSGVGGALELVKPAREPASSRPKPCASLKKPHESCPLAAPCWPS